MCIPSSALALSYQDHVTLSHTIDGGPTRKFYSLIATIMEDSSTTVSTVALSQRLSYKHLVLTTRSNSTFYSNIRLKSAVLSTFPWATDFLNQNIAAAINDPAYSVSKPFKNVHQLLLISSRLS